jgi:xylulokinase
MNKELLLGIDIGTQGVKGILADAAGAVHAHHQVEHGCFYPRPDWCEQDMTRNWWQNPVVVIRRLIEDSTVSPGQIKAICVSGLYPALGPTDGEGNPIAKAILYSDNRSVAEVQEVNQVRGLQLTTEELTPKLIWFLRNEPQLAAKMRKFFDAAHYLVFKLTGEYVTDTITTGLYGAIYQSPSASWRADVCAHFGIPLEILPDVHPPGEFIGEVTQAAAEITGLEAGTPVLPGMPDLVASLLSVGAVHTYESAAYYGTAGLVPVMKADLLTGMFEPYPIEERGLTPQDGYIFDYPTYSLTTGDTVRWFRDEFAPLEMKVENQVGGKNAYAALDDLFDTIFTIQEEINPDLDIMGVVATFYDQRTIVSRDILAKLQNDARCRDLMCRTLIRNNTTIAASSDAGKPVVFFRQGSYGAKDYIDLAQELLDRE